MALVSHIYSRSAHTTRKTPKPRRDYGARRGPTVYLPPIHHYLVELDALSPSRKEHLERQITPWPTAVEPLSAAEVGRIQAVFDGLPPEEQELLRLRYEEGKTEAEIHRILGVRSQQVVSARLQRACQKLCALMMLAITEQEIVEILTAVSYPCEQRRVRDVAAWLLGRNQRLNNSQGMQTNLTTAIKARKGLLPLECAIVRALKEYRKLAGLRTRRLS